MPSYLRQDRATSLSYSNCYIIADNAVAYNTTNLPWLPSDYWPRVFAVYNSMGVKPGRVNLLTFNIWGGLP